jgi:hypothetical protein
MVRFLFCALLAAFASGAAVAADKIKSLSDLACSPGDFVRQDQDTGDWSCLTTHEMKWVLGIDGPVFVTSAGYTGDLVSEAATLGAPAGLDGLASGDFICTHHAKAAGIPVPYIAWLSSNTIDAKERLTFDGPYLRPDGEQIAVDRAALTNPDSALLNPINRDEYNDEWPATAVWTGTYHTGTRTGASCQNWTTSLVGNFPTGQGTYGRSSTGTSERWTVDGILPCNRSFRLYCFPK